MFKIIIMCAAVIAVISFSSCIKDKLSTDKEETVVTSFYATSGDVNSKTLLAENNEVHWIDGDKVKVLLFPTMTGYKIQSNEFTANFTGESSSDAHFTTGGWSIENSWAYGEYVYAFYPANIESSVATSSGAVSKIIQYNLPAAQVAVSGSFASNLNLSFAVGYLSAFTSNQATLYFKNACALLRVNIPEVENLVSLVVTSSSDAPLAGMPSNLTCSGEGKNASMTLASSWNSKSSSVTLTDDNGMRAGAYYFVVWPGSHNGLSFEFLDKNGSKCVKELNSAVTFSAGRIETVNFKSSIEFSQDPFIEVDKNAINATAKGETYTIAVEANNVVTVSSSANWVTTSYSDGQCRVIVNANTTDAERSTDVNITAGGLTKTVSVSQPCITYKVVSTTPIQNAGFLYTEPSVSYLSNNKLYVIANKATEKFMTASTAVVSFETLAASATFYSKHVFQYYEDWKYEQSFDSAYTCNSGGTLFSLGQNAYLNSDAQFAAPEKSQYLSISNRWGSDAPGDMDVYKYDAGTTSLWVNNDGNSVVFDSAEYNGTVGRRKWVFYEVQEQ